jgi:cysteine desulfurase
MTPIYFDHNATTPMLPEVAAAMAECYAAGYANPASQHQAGRRARQVVEEAREAIGRLVGADVDRFDADRVTFTSGGTEANNLAIAGLGADRPGALIISAIEHPSITGPAERLEKQAQIVERIGVTCDGVIDVEKFDAMLTHVALTQRRSPGDVRLVSVMLGNNETGVLQPVAEIAARCTAAGVPVHTDAVQVVGKLPVDFRALGVAAMTFSAHKFHGPVGIGALVLRHGVSLTPQLVGGFQQAGLRPGTESVPLVVGFRTALELWHRQRDERLAQLTALRDRFEHTLTAACPELVVNSAGAPRLPHTSNIAFPGINRQALLMALDLAGVACSTGSACASGSSEPSPTLVAMGCPQEVLEGSLRFSFGATTTPAEVDEGVGRILAAYKDLRIKNLGRKMPAVGRSGG